ncbi:hypothetical protein GCM10010973_16520 [Cribrihabitans marinus]|nr:hypothetical protein GCM10010973_16520 [Cribrihabitans marinus]
MLPVSIDTSHTPNRPEQRERPESSKAERFEAVFGQIADAAPSGNGSSEAEDPAEPQEAVVPPENDQDPEGDLVAPVAFGAGSADGLPSDAPERIAGVGAATEPVSQRRRPDLAFATGEQQGGSVEHRSGPLERTGADLRAREPANPVFQDGSVRREVQAAAPQSPPSAPVSRIALPLAPEGDPERSAAKAGAELAEAVGTAPETSRRVPGEAISNVARTRPVPPERPAPETRNSSAIAEPALEPDLRGDSAHGAIADAPGMLEAGPRQIGSVAAAAAMPQAHAAETARSVAAQLSDAVQRRSEGRFELSLNPEELGRVQLSVRSTETGLVVTLLTERAETQELMRRHMDQLAEEFSRIGYGDVAFDFSGSGGDPSDRPREQGLSAIPVADTGAVPAAERAANALHCGLDMRL